MRVNLVILPLGAGIVFGQIAETPKRTIVGSGVDSGSRSAPKLVRPTAPPADAEKPVPASDNSRGASSRALDALNSSNEDLNVIRDKNVRGLTAGGCAPESAARIADIAAKLQGAGVSVDVAKTPRDGDDVRPGSETAMLALASDWFKRTGDAVSATSGKDQKEALLNSVMPGAGRSAASEADVTNLKTELDHLLASCAGVKR
jgi:hypothetical protein